MASTPGERSPRSRAGRPVAIMMSVLVGLLLVVLIVRQAARTTQPPSSPNPVLATTASTSDATDASTPNEPVVQVPPPATEAPPAPPLIVASTSQRTSTVHFKNCDEARAAGAAPIYSGQPGYDTDLDRNTNGVACE